MFHATKPNIFFQNEIPRADGTKLLSLNKAVLIELSSKLIPGNLSRSFLVQGNEGRGCEIGAGGGACAHRMEILISRA